jgi:endonuclease/exonuclease/phosphatase family metal-dependent hydrolase
MKRRSQWFVVLLVVVIVVAVVVGIGLRRRLRCAGFAGPGVSAAELPPGPPRAGNLRLAAWNIRNFPYDDRPQYPDLGYFRHTNICDLEQVLKGLDADVLGVEEIREPQRFERILRASGKGREYRAVFSAGGGRWGQHVGIAWDQERLRLAAQPQEVKEVALDDTLRPALAAYLRSTHPDGVDLTVVEVHLRAGPRGYDERLEQYRRLATWVNGWVQKVGDEDVVVQGDFNTTGPPGGTAADELAAADQILGGAGLRRLVNTTGCSEYWEGPGKPDGVQIPGLLDQVYVRGLQELDRDVPLQSWLHCFLAGCQQLISRPGHEDGTFWDVSDHCPLTYQIEDKDLD